MMCLKLSLLLLGLSMAMAYRVQLSLKSEAKIQKLRSDSVVLAESHRDLSSTCFPLYNPQLSFIADQYEVEYDRCIVAYDDSNALIENTYKDTRLKMEENAYCSCLSLKICKQGSTAYNVFECASAKASDDAKIFYEISANATDAAARCKSDYHQVETTKSICVSEAERNYVENTSNVYGQLNACLLGNHQTPPVVRPSETTEDPTWWDSTIGEDF